MKVYRGFPKKVCIDSKTPSKYLDEFAWKDGLEIQFRGVKKDFAERETDLSVRIEEQDVIALFIAFLKADPRRLFALLSDDLKARDQEVEKLDRENAILLGRLRRLTTKQSQ